MPCTMTGSLEGDRALAATEAADNLSNELTRITAAFCDLCTALERDPSAHKIIDYSPMAYDWWVRHQEVDRKRVAREALAKLTTEEIRAIRAHPNA